MILICQNRVIHVQVMNWRSLNMFTRIKLTNSWVTWRSYSTLKIICLSTQYIVVRWFKFCLSASFYQHIYRFVAEPFLQEESVVVTTFVSEMGKMVGKTIQVRITFQTKYFEATSERPMNRHRHRYRYRPNLEVRQGLAKPPNLQVRSAEPRPNQFTK